MSIVAEPTKTTNPVLRLTLAAALIVEHAERCGLAVPTIVSVTEIEIRFQFASLEALTDWALWMGAPITEEAYDGTFGSSTHYTATGDALDQRIVCVRVEKGADQ